MRVIPFTDDAVDEHGIRGMIIGAGFMIDLLKPTFQKQRVVGNAEPHICTTGEIQPYECEAIHCVGHFYGKSV